MNAFDDARTVENRSRAIILPFLKRSAHNGQFVLFDKGRLARHLQETLGDLVLNTDEKTFWAVELKSEAEDKYGNIFLETWSNRNLDNVASHAERGSNVGWLYKSRADLMFYHFIADDKLYVFDFFLLKRWAFGWKDSGGTQHPANIFSQKYQEKVQGKRSQMNDTWGRCVPIADVCAAVRHKIIHPLQIPLFDEMDAVA